MLWRRRDIYASDDAAAKAEAENLYRAHASQQSLTSFYLCDSAGKPIYESAKRTPLKLKALRGEKRAGDTG